MKVFLLREINFISYARHKDKGCPLITTIIEEKECKKKFILSF